MIHHGFQYKEGLNVDTVPFNPTGECSPGGLHFCEMRDVYRYLNYGSLIADVESPSDALVYEEPYKLKADRIILSNIRKWSDDMEIAMKAVERDGAVLRFSLKWRNDREVVMKAVEQCGWILCYASEELRNDRKIVMKAVGQNGWSLQFASDELRNDREVVMKAIMFNGNALKHASKDLQNDRELAMKAVKTDIQEQICFSIYHI